MLKGKIKPPLFADDFFGGKSVLICMKLNESPIATPEMKVHIYIDYITILIDHVTSAEVGG